MRRDDDEVLPRVPRSVLATGGDDRLAGGLALPPQEVARRHRGASCQSPVNHLPLSLALWGERSVSEEAQGGEARGGEARGGEDVADKEMPSVRSAAVP